VELLQALAWAVKVDDAARARVSKNSERRNFIGPPDFVLRLIQGFDAGHRLNPTSGCTIAWVAGTLNAQRVNREVN
jgi:hypothetical protein